jgi:outer membrane protein TolC
VAAAAMLSLGGCVVYHAQPLPIAADTRPDAGALKVDIAQFRVGPLKSIMVDPRDGLDPLEVAVLAVLNSPDLQAKRTALKVSGAEVFAAGLLPDPQVSVEEDHPISGPDHESAYSVQASLDLAALIARSNSLSAARFTAQQADLDLLWAEWQTAQQARQLAQTALADEARATNLRQVYAAASERYARSSAALVKQDTSLQTVAADLSVKLDAQTQLATAEHDAQKARRDLNALLNLDAAVQLPLVQGPPSAAYEQATLNDALGSLPTRRPDLLALKAGYGAQDANFRKAVLAQFPINQVMVAFAKDPAGTTTQGLAASLAAPIFNGGRGDARIQEATREQLRAEYQARLDQSEAEVKDAQAELASATVQAAALRAEAPRLQSMLRPITDAYDRGDIDSQTYLTLSQTALSRQADLDDRELTARLAQIQLETVLFLPPATSRAAR